MTEQQAQTTRASMPTFEPGDRVRLKADDAENWIDLKLRTRAKKGRLATVVRVIGTAIPHWKRSYAIQFDQVGREQSLFQIIPVRDLEAGPMTDHPRASRSVLIPKAVLYHWSERLDEIRQYGVREPTDATYLKIAQVKSKSVRINVDVYDIKELLAECDNWLTGGTEVQHDTDPSDRRIKRGYQALQASLRSIAR